MFYENEMRLPYIKPENLTPEQQKVYDLNIEAMKNMPYVWLTPDKELNGPSNLLMHEPEIGYMFFKLNREIISTSIQRNTGSAHEVAVLVTVASAKAHYGMYAHTQLAKKFELTDEQIAAIMNGMKPVDLNDKESAAYDLAVALNGVGAIPGDVYDRCKSVLGQEGLNALVFAIGMFKMVGTILNAFNEPVPEYRI